MRAAASRTRSRLGRATGVIDGGLRPIASLGAMTGARSVWWAAVSLVVVGIGAFEPWAQRLGVGVDGTDDELVGIVAVVAALALLVFAVTRSRVLAAVPLLAGLLVAMVVGHDLTDPAGPFGGPGPNIHLEWGIWAVLGGSVGLVLASVVLLVETRKEERALRLRPGTPGLSYPARLQARLRKARYRSLASNATGADAAERATRAVEKLESEWRANFVRVASRMTAYLSAEREGRLFFLPTFQKAGRDRFAKPEWKETRHLRRALETLKRLGTDTSERIFIDVGAHIGTTVITAVGSFGFGAGVAFEPDPDNFRLLQANLAVNDLAGKIRACNVAISSQPGQGELVLRPEMGSKHRLRLVQDREAGGPTVEVVSLDAFLEQASIDAGSVGLLWLDIEGHELEALQGSRLLLDQSVPIVMEFVPRNLRRGSLDALHAELARSYTHVCDLRNESDLLDLLPLASLPELSQHYRRSFTDLLVVRLPERGGTGKRDDVLTPRELEVLKLVAEGHSSQQIAATLVISVKTVERHRANIIKKLGVRDRVGLTRYAIRRGLIEP